MSLDLNDPQQNMRAFLKARASTDGSETVVWFGGDVWSWMPGGQSRPLFGFEGYNIARAVEVDGGYDLLTREAVFYQDPFTRQILDKWTNPFTDQEVEVVHIWNDPVNQQLRLQGPRGPWRVPAAEIGEDVLFKIDVPLAYPSPLPRAEFPEESQDDTYAAVELFGFYAKRADLDAETALAPCVVSWTRICPWLPFMRMADRPGQLVYHGRGAKLAGGYADLPEHIRARTDGTPFASAPTEFSVPNETSWTYYKKLTERR